jgi:outer membrane receptor protein involved in Fe transport
MKLSQRFTFLLLLLLVPVFAFAQGTTGTLQGTVTQGGVALPGATVTVTSPALQGTRTQVTNANGAYSFPSLPPGDYNVAFSLEGMTTVNRKVNVGLVSAARVDADMKMSAVAEAITVTASAPAVMETTTVETNFKQATINRLPTGRTPAQQAALAPGVTGGINGNSISGAMSYDNLYLVNGAVVNENLRGQPHNLFIEDAIQETTVLQGGVSAEFGRFTGGVVSAITKSGGNEFSGSVRDSLDNPKWTAKSIATQATPINHVNNTYEETLGGRVIKDRIWFFVAGRQAKISQARNLGSILTTGLPNPAIGAYTISQSTPRNEAKVTANVTSKHSIIASYINNNQKADKNCQFTCLDLRNINTAGVKNPNNFKTLHYNGILTNNLLVEGDYAKKYFAFVGFGGSTPAHQANPTAAYLAEGTPGIDQLVTGGFFNAPYFCGSCGAELRNNKEWDVKARYFLGTKSLGTHNVSLGYDVWAEQRLSNNYQSPTDFRYDVRFNVPKQMPDGTVQIALAGAANGSRDRFLYFPVAFASLGSNLKTSSVFINDKWDFNQHFSFNLGGRYDKNNAVDSAGHPASNDKGFSPRLGIIFDTFGNGRLRFDANYGKYIGRLAETVSGNGSAAGNPATIRWAYAGPDTGYLDSRVALQQAFQWFLDNGFTTRTIVSQAIPGFNSKLIGSLKSPSQREFTVGAGLQLGKGYLRTDYINRKWENFYAAFTSLAIGTVVNPANGSLSDLTLTGNSNVPERKYWGLQFQGNYQLPKGFGIGGNYTYSKLRGNTEGESGGAGPGTFGASTVAYKEFQAFPQNAPVGFLAPDQRHKLRVWGSYDLGTPIGHFNIGVIERFDSGSPFSAAQTVAITNSMLCSNGASNATTCIDSTHPTAGQLIYPNGAARTLATQYASIPTGVTYFFSNRGAFRWADIIATDLALNYELPIRNVGLFAKGEVRNAFNRKAVISGNTLVSTALVADPGKNTSSFAPFNPFTQTPKECPRGTALADCAAMGANFQLGPSFGQSNGTATTFSQNGNYQLPRTYLFSVGARF